MNVDQTSIETESAHNAGELAGRGRFVVIGTGAIVLVLVVAGIFLASGSGPHSKASSKVNVASPLDRSELHESTRIIRTFAQMLSDYTKDEIGGGATQCAIFNQAVLQAPAERKAGIPQTNYSNFLSSETEVGLLCREVFNESMSLTKADAMAHEQSVAVHEVALFARSIGGSGAIPAIRAYRLGSSEVPTPTGPHSGFAVLPPQSRPPVSAECSEPLTKSADGDATPLSCPSGGINVLAWVHYATNNLGVMSLGRKATATSVYSAMCADSASGHSTNPIESSAEQLAARYNGWTFGDDAQFAQYLGGNCAPMSTTNSVVATPTTPSTTTPPTTALSCPSGTPRSTVTYTSSSVSDGTDYWNLNLTATVTNHLPSAIEVFSETVQVVDASGNALQPQTLATDSGGFVTLFPGQSTVLTNVDDALEATSSEPTPTSDSVSWAWAEGSPYARCPSASG